MELAGIQEYEKILIANLTNGHRLETYAIREKNGSGTVSLNGAAARLGEAGDIIIILSFALMDEKEAASFVPTVVVMDENNNPTKK